MVLPGMGPAGSTSISTTYSRMFSTCSVSGLRSGSRKRVAITMVAMPTIATGRPMAAKPNRPKPLPVASINMPLTTRLVLVPISVQVPPRMAA